MTCIPITSILIYRMGAILFSSLYLYLFFIDVPNHLYHVADGVTIVTTSTTTRSAGSMAERLTTVPLLSLENPGAVPVLPEDELTCYQEVPGSTPGWIVFL